MPAATMGDAAETGVGFIDHRLLVNPLEYLMPDHLTQRSLCRRLERLAG